MEPMQVAENGSFAIIGDPGGAGIGAWQPDQVTGFEIWNEPGAPRWFELHLTAYDATVDYRDVFGWNTNTYSDTPDFRYTTLRSGADDLAGIMDASQLSEGAAPVGRSTSASRTRTPLSSGSSSSAARSWRPRTRLGVASQRLPTRPAPRSS